MKQHAMKVSVIIVNYNVKYFLEVCLNSVFKAAQGYDVEVLVADNNSSDGSCNLIRHNFPEVVLLENKENLGFSKANNLAYAKAKGEYILFLNPDTVMPEDFFKRTLAYMDAHPDTGALGPKLLDGKGQFAPDSKKSLPTLTVAFYKTTGINKLFAKSPYFNKYYAVHIGEDETAQVEVLSGCCMLVRNTVIKKLGFAFDEDYFMYCEDVDLSYRITKAGFKNIYFPEAELIHYKGESTRKMTFSYVRIFNEALIKFARKHFTAGQARWYLMFASIGVILRAVSGAMRLILKLLRMPLFDALILFVTLYLIKDFWVLHIKNLRPIPLSSVFLTFPVYIALWIMSMFLNGAYDQPYRPLRVTRGMIIGTIMILAYYGLLKADLRYSRAIIIFTGFVGTVLLLGLHELLYRLGIVKLIPFDKLPKKAVIAADVLTYHKTEELLHKVHYAPEIEGRISINEHKDDALTDMPNIKELLYTAGIDEVIFCVNGLSYMDMFSAMKQCGNNYDYKIHISGSQSFIGSNSSRTSGDLYTLDKGFDLEKFGLMRNKRLLDIISALAFILLWPFLCFFVKRPFHFWGNCFAVFLGTYTWVSYKAEPITNLGLPKIKSGILPPYNLIEGYRADDKVRAHLCIHYAQQYTAGKDVKLILKNFKYLGSTN